MGKLKPIGSEKLEGMAKINRMIELARYKENKPNIVNEDSSNEYSIRLSDGMKYHIIKEKNGYVIKKGLNESTLEYIEPMKGRKYYSTYSQALKRLNLVTKEVNLLEGNNRNISLFNEGEEGEKKYFLSMKRETKEQGPPAAAPQPAPQPAPSPQPSPEPTPSGSTEPSMDMEMPMDDMGPEGEEPTPTDMESPEGEGKEEAVTFKTIQKLTGKLGQKLRTLNSDEETQMSSKDIKYVINSILSALDLNNLEDDDKESIMSKLEGEEEEGIDDEASDDMDSEEPVEPDDSGEEVTAEPPQEPSSEPLPEMTEDENFDDLSSLESEFDSLESSAFSDLEDDSSGPYEKTTDVTQKMEEMFEGIFSESKVDKILKGYFKPSENENKVVNERKETLNKVFNLSETISQEVSARKFISKYKNAKLIGRTKSQNLVFEVNDRRVMIDKKGQIL